MNRMRTVGFLILLMLCGGCGQIRASHTWVDRWLDDSQLADAKKVVQDVALREGFEQQPIVERWREEKWVQIYTLPYKRDDVAGGWSHLAIMSRLSETNQRFEVHIYESEGDAESKLGQRVRIAIRRAFADRFGEDIVYSTAD